jgi:hypothetical protein
MLGNYPIIIDGNVCGRLEVTREGLMTVFSAECEDVGRIVRLSVYGEDGAEGYLGVMMPEGGKMVLRRAMSRSALDIFPQNITEAAEAGRQRAEPEPAPTPETEPEAAPETDTLWFPVPEGTLVSVGGMGLIALPLDAQGTLSGEERVIEGRRYAVVSASEIAIPAG